MKTLKICRTVMSQHSLYESIRVTCLIHALQCGHHLRSYYFILPRGSRLISSVGKLNNSGRLEVNFEVEVSVSDA